MNRKHIIILKQNFVLVRNLWRKLYIVFIAGFRETAWYSCRVRPTPVNGSFLFFFSTPNVCVSVPGFVMVVSATLITPNFHSHDISNFGNMEFKDK
jgi:hypothetical protein